MSYRRPACHHHDARPISPEKRARIEHSMKAIEERGAIGSDEFLAKLDAALQRRQHNAEKPSGVSDD